jgi:hypothetical protein
MEVSAQTQVEPLTGLHTKGKLLVLPENIRLGLKWQTVQLITAGKTFHSTGTWYPYIRTLFNARVGDNPP